MRGLIPVPCRASGPRRWCGRRRRLVVRQQSPRPAIHLLRRTPLLRGPWLNYLVVAAALSFSAFFELIEWWAALVWGGEADAFLATQGDVWDTQWDMFLALCGAILALLLLGRRHDRQLGIGASGVRLRVAPDMPRAMADGPLLAQALRHLLDNAVRFSRLRAAPVIEVGFDATQRAWFVRDNGIGFEPAQAERLFGLFQRLHADPTDPGLGIGLAIVARIIERHEGAVWADSVPGEGATFWLRIGPRGIAAPEA